MLAILQYLADTLKDILTRKEQFCWSI